MKKLHVKYAAASSYIVLKLVNHGQTPILTAFVDKPRVLHPRPLYPRMMTYFTEYADKLWVVGNSTPLFRGSDIRCEN